MIIGTTGCNWYWNNIIADRGGSATLGDNYHTAKQSSSATASPTDN